MIAYIGTVQNQSLINFGPIAVKGYVPDIILEKSGTRAALQAPVRIHVPADREFALSSPAMNRNLSDIIGELNAALQAADHETVAVIAADVVQRFSAILPNSHRSRLAASLSQFASTLSGNGRDRPARQLAELAFALFPSEDTYFKYWLFNLYDGNYNAAWSIDAYRRATHGSNAWTIGAPASRVTIFNSNGMGDLIQFMRFVPLVRRHAEEVRMIVPDRLVALCHHAPALDGIAIGSASDPLAPEATCEMIALPQALGLRTTDLAPADPYIRFSEAELRPWRNVVRTGGGLHVGLVWAAGPDDPRSIGFTRLQTLIDRYPEVRFIGLQANAAKCEIPFSTPPNFTDFGVYDIDNTAKIISCLDLVISVCCGVCHLSCAIGTPTLVLLRKHCDWRWIEEGRRCRWYIAATLLRQDTEGDWDGVLQDAGSHIQAFLQHGRRPTLHWNAPE